MENLSALKDYIFAAPRNIVIIPHQKPDGDAMGSSLGLYHFLKKTPCASLKVLCPTDYPAFLKWLPGKSEVMIHPFMPHKSPSLIERADVIFCLDYNGLGRINELGEMVKQAKGIKVMIDHHTLPENFQDLQLWDDTAASTCELIYKLIAEEWNAPEMIDATIAKCLYTGIMTDTGSFRFSATRPYTHRVAAALMETGVETHLIHEVVYDNGTESRLRILGFALLHAMKVLPHQGTAYFVISREATQRYNMEAGDTEGLVNYGLSMKGIDFSVLILEDENIVKLSFRSKGEFAVNLFAQHFGGGGHLNAAGGKSTESLADTENKFLELLGEIRPATPL
jgi:phosphoesterase RecJ-like protein